MNKQNKKTFLKLVYFDEQAAVDFLETMQEGIITEKITKKMENYGGVEGSASIGKGLFDFLKVGLSGNFGKNTNSLVETQISRTVFTEFISESENNQYLVKFSNMKLTIAKDSLTYYRNITPYLKMFTNLETISDDENMSALNHLEMDKILDNAKGYYEFIGIDECNKKYIIRFNINGMKNNYSLYDLVKMNLSIQGIKVGETQDLNLEFEHEIQMMIQENDTKINNSETKFGADFGADKSEEDKEEEKNDTCIDIIDVIIAGV